MQDYKNLKVWERSHQLTLEVYQATATFPKDEQYGLTSQIRRASVSIPANIVLLNHLWISPFMLRLHPAGYAQHERA